MAKKVFIICTDGTTIEGILGWTWKDCLKVKSATIHSRGDAVKAQGHLEVYPFQILWMQVGIQTEGT